MKLRPYSFSEMWRNMRSRAISHGFSSMAESIRHWRPDDFDRKVRERMDHLKLYDLERYLFDVVKPTFDRDRKLEAFDFFCIIIWKANRAKSKVARRIVTCDKRNRSEDLNAIVGDMTSAIYEANRSDREQMRILKEEWKFHLPMASAILTILYPEVFTVYDIRVCNVLGKYREVQDKSQFDDLWKGYCAYRDDVRNAEPSVSSLRDKDRILWAKSFEKQLRDDISTLFSKDRARND
jgi:hypothetical protein